MKKGFVVWLVVLMIFSGCDKVKSGSADTGTSSEGEDVYKRQNYALYYSYLHNIMFQVNGEIREYRCGSLLFHFYALFYFAGLKARKNVI